MTAVFDDGTIFAWFFPGVQLETLRAAMNGTQSPGSSPAASGKYAQQLAELRQRISQDENIGSQLRAGGEPGMVGPSGVDDQTLLRWLKAEKCGNVSTPVLTTCSLCAIANNHTLPEQLPAYCNSVCA